MATSAESWRLQSIALLRQITSLTEAARDALMMDDDALAGVYLGQADNRFAELRSIVHHEKD